MLFVDLYTELLNMLPIMQFKLEWIMEDRWKYQYFLEEYLELCLSLILAVGG